MRILAFFLMTGASVALAASSPYRMKGAEVLLWPNGAPGSDGKRAPERWIEGATGAAFIVAPGGGHRYLVMDPEREFVAEKLNAMGVAAFVLKSRLENAAGSVYKAAVESVADMQRAVRLVRWRAKDWGVDGGHLAFLAANHFDAGKPASTDAVEKMGSRPDFAVLAYPGYLGPNTRAAKDSPPTFLFVNGDDPLSADVVNGYELHVFRRGGHGVGTALA